MFLDSPAISDLAPMALLALVYLSILFLAVNALLSIFMLLKLLNLFRYSLANERVIDFDFLKDYIAVKDEDLCKFNEP